MTAADLRVTAQVGQWWDLLFTLHFPRGCIFLWLLKVSSNLPSQAGMNINQ